MTEKPNIMVTAVFHKEGPLALPALDSMKDLVSVARASGLTVEACVIRDRADGQTHHLVAARGMWLDGIEEVSFGNLGLSRNARIRAAHGDFLAFLDGDDLRGSEWLRLAYNAAAATPNVGEAIWHP
jgi:hypothetical protein